MQSTPRSGEDRHHRNRFTTSKNLHVNLVRTSELQECMFGVVPAKIDWAFRE
jgi:hypothetical protein